MYHADYFGGLIGACVDTHYITEDLLSIPIEPEDFLPNHPYKQMLGFIAASRISFEGFWSLLSYLSETDAKKSFEEFRSIDYIERYTALPQTNVFGVDVVARRFDGSESKFFCLIPFLEKN